MESELKGKNIHIIGIGGTGMSPIAHVLCEIGANVSGSDMVASNFTHGLEKLGAKVSIGHTAENIQNPDMVVYSSAIHDDNPELIQARNQNIPLFKRMDFLKKILSGRDVIAIAGTHGKTTTTSMTAWVLHECGIPCGFIIGSVAKNLHSNATAGNDTRFVIEADEYDNMFLGIQAKYAVLTKLEHDHPDCFPTKASYFAAFQKFLSQTRSGGTILINADDPNQSGLDKNKKPLVKTVKYGLSEAADYRAIDLSLQPNGCFAFNFVTADDFVVPVHLSVHGRHNVYNALAVMSICELNQIDLQQAAQALSTFDGIERRFEKIAEENGIIVIDDYAHHPTEINATLDAARDSFPGRRVWALWQPHTFSRTKLLLNEFRDAVEKADEVLVCNIYASREKETDFGFADLQKAFTRKDIRFAQSNQDATEILATELKPGDIVVTLSAGDANLIGPKALEIIKSKESHN